MEKRLDGLSLVGGARLPLSPAVQSCAESDGGGTTGASCVGDPADVPPRHTRGLVDREPRRDRDPPRAWLHALCAAARRVRTVDAHGCRRRTRGAHRPRRRARQLRPLRCAGRGQGHPHPPWQSDRGAGRDAALPPARPAAHIHGISSPSAPSVRAAGSGARIALPLRREKTCRGV